MCALLLLLLVFHHHHHPHIKKNFLCVYPTTRTPHVVVKAGRQTGRKARQRSTEYARNVVRLFYSMPLLLLLLLLMMMKKKRTIQNGGRRRRVPIFPVCTTHRNELCCEIQRKKKPCAVYTEKKHFSCLPSPSFAQRALCTEKLLPRCAFK